MTLIRAIVFVCLCTHCGGLRYSGSDRKEVLEIPDKTNGESSWDRLFQRVGKAQVGNVQDVLASNPFRHDGVNFCQVDGGSCRLLYEAANIFAAQGILEIGAFCGCSTSCIAKSLNDHERNTTFHSADLFLESVAEFETYFEGLCGGPGTCHPADDVKWVLEHGGFKKFYDEHLQSLGLQSRVSPVKGDFMKTLVAKPYGMIYLDVTHNVDEIHRNLKYIVENFASDGTVIIMDDVSANEDNIQEVLKVANCKKSKAHGRMYACLL